MVSNDETRSILQQFKPAVDLLVSISALAGSIVYFGWVRTTALYEYFGVDAKLLGFSIQDYLLRSTDVLFRPVLCLLVGTAFGLFFLALTNRMVETLRREVLQWRVFAPTTGVGVVLLSIALLGLNESAPILLAAICLGLGSFILFCSLKMAVSLYLTDEKPWVRTLNQWASVLTGIAIFTALFWATTVYAQQMGSLLASHIDHNPKEFSRAVPPVALYSRSPLGLTQKAGVTESKLAGPVDARNYRYTGYRLLIYSNSRWFLIPSRSSFDSGSSVILVLIDDSSIMVTICYHECDHL